jgi:hypothetical protein
MAVVVWHDLDADSASVIEHFEDLEWIDVGGDVIGSASLLPSRALIAIANDGRIATGNGLDYCLTVWGVAGRTPSRICRDRPRARIG